jgi:FixJ family two-component response regulator
LAARVLISVIDDDESVRVATASLLRSAGYMTESFASAEEFLGSGNVARFGCIVTDIQMAGMSGIELTLRVADRRPAVPVILMTARAEQDIHARAETCGAAFVLKKPYTADSLLACLDMVLRLA